MVSVLVLIVVLLVLGASSARASGTTSEWMTRQSFVGKPSSVAPDNDRYCEVRRLEKLGWNIVNNYYGITVLDVPSQTDILWRFVTKKGKFLDERVTLRYSPVSGYHDWISKRYPPI